MRNRRDFVVTYTTLDNKARRLKDSLFSDNIDTVCKGIVDSFKKKYILK